MSDAIRERTETLSARAAPHLSHSRVNRYLHCPEQYRLYYVEGLRPRATPAALVFGQAVHEALAVLFRGQGDSVRFFRGAWDEAKGMNLGFSTRESWEKLSTIGEALVAKFVKDELPRVTSVTAVEEPFTLDVTSLELPFVGVIDLVAELQGIPTIIDFKTSASAYAEHEVMLSDQLTAYRLARPEVTNLALCVLVKTKESAIEWHVTRRKSADVMEYLDKVGYVGREIQAGRFYRRPGKWCAWCDYLPVCVGDEARARETLIRVG